MYQMKQLTINEVQQIEGGFLPALVALVTIFTLPKIINDHRVEYNEWGQQLGETTWEHFHPYDPNS